MAGGRGKSRYFSTALPTPPSDHEVPPLEIPEASSPHEPIGKYEGRASVGPQVHDDELAGPDEASTSGEQWVDPLDDDTIDLTLITIDLRETMIDSPPDTYYQRHSSRVPGHQ